MVMQLPVRCIMLNSMLPHIAHSLWCSVEWGAVIMPADRGTDAILMASSPPAPAAGRWSSYVQ